MSLRLDTRCVHGDLGDPARFSEQTRAVSFPIYQTATFAHLGVGRSTGYDYTREKNPTTERLEQVLSSLEGAAGSVSFGSGMAAVTAVMDLLSAGDHVVASEDLYGGVVRYLATVGERHGVGVTYVDTSDLSAVERAIRPTTRLLYVETPSNPMMRVCDLAAAAGLAHAHGLLLAVDNTFLSPYLQNPLGLGADLVVHSASKFLSGHNDTVAGFVCCATPELAERVRLVAKTTGGVLAPFDAWLVLRGLKTLAVRMERQQATAGRVAAWLEGRPGVSEVLYVGLPGHPGHDVNARQARGAGSTMSLRTDTPERARQVLERVRLVTFAESLGGTETLVTYPAVQTHPDVPQDMRERLGITDTLLRLSVGLEDAADLIDDLAQALEG